MADQRPAGRSNREVTRVGAGLVLLALLIVFVLLALIARRQPGRR